MWACIFFANASFLNFLSFLWLILLGIQFFFYCKRQCWVFLFLLFLLKVGLRNQEKLCFLDFGILFILGKALNFLFKWAHILALLMSFFIVRSTGRFFLWFTFILFLFLLLVVLQNLQWLNEVLSHILVIWCFVVFSYVTKALYFLLCQFSCLVDSEFEEFCFKWVFC